MENQKKRKILKAAQLLSRLQRDESFQIKVETESVAPQKEDLRDLEERLPNDVVVKVSAPASKNYLLIEKGDFNK